MFLRIVLRSVCAVVLVGGLVTDAGARVRLGLEGGLNEARATWSPNAGTLDLQHRRGLTGGVTVDVPLASTFSLGTGLLYVGCGELTTVKFASISGGGTMWQHLRFHYLDVPIHLRFRPATAHGLFLTAGPDIEYLAAIGHEEGGIMLLGPHAGIRTPAAPTSTIYEDMGTFGSDPKGLYRPWNFAASGGLGYEFPFARHAGMIEARYTQGLTDIVRSTAIERRTRNYQALLGFTW